MIVNLLSPFKDKLTGEIEMVSDLNTKTTNFQQKVKEIAEQEWRFFCQGQKKEDEYGYYQRVGQYWREGVGIGDRDGRDTQHRWSAAFISWVMKKAGAGNRFKYSSMHFDYIRDAIEKRNDPNSPFKGYRLNEYVPKVGDLVCFSSGKDPGKINYDTTKRYRSHCDIVVSIRAGAIDVIGGNVQKSVFKKPCRIDSQGYLILDDDTPPWFVVIQNLLQLDNSSETMPDYNARVKKSLNEQLTLKNKKEHCCANPDKLATIDRTVGHQIRIRRNDDEYAIYTVSETRQEDPDNFVYMNKQARSRFGMSDEFDAIVKAQVVDAFYKDDEANEETGKEAEAKNQFIEYLKDNGTHKGLIIIAPHGGAIEKYTGEQAELVATQLNVSCWRCKGWWKNDENGEAYDRWHITSTDIHEASFPLLNTVINRGFTYAVAFHGFEKDDSNDEDRDRYDIFIGGGADLSLKLEIQIAIQNAIDNADRDNNIRVGIANAEDRYGGDNPKNIVNRLASCNGIQIEQSKNARKYHWQEIAAAVASVYRDKI
jgi:phage replication-related protein YjqB (UPF0714/DUF867 family)